MPKQDVTELDIFYISVMTNLIAKSIGQTY